MICFKKISIIHRNLPNKLLKNIYTYITQQTKINLDNDTINYVSEFLLSVIEHCANTKLMFHHFISIMSRRRDILIIFLLKNVLFLLVASIERMLSKNIKFFSDETFNHMRQKKIFRAFVYHVIVNFSAFFFFQSLFGWT